MSFDEWADQYSVTHGFIISDERSVAKLAWDAALATRPEGERPAILEEAAKMCERAAEEWTHGLSSSGLRTLAKQIRDLGRHEPQESVPSK